MGVGQNVAMWRWRAHLLSGVGVGASSVERLLVVVVAAGRVRRHHARLTHLIRKDEVRLWPCVAVEQLDLPCAHTRK